MQTCWIHKFGKNVSLEKMARGKNNKVEELTHGNLIHLEKIVMEKKNWRFCRHTECYIMIFDYVNIMKIWNNT